ncbi:MerR family transcriptional regulator [Sagittula sp. SSi028]|uniref:MerR family transcriptional regulator n=1 Tax=Sagittula sp. SSi028 TaxID=3400636 RepID=UPI003AF41FFD
MSKSRDAFRTISEVSEWLETPAHVLRFWESKFTQVKPVKRAGGRRYYRPADMELLGGIKKLLHDDGMTIKGVQKILREQGVRHVCAMSMPVDPEDQIEDAPFIEAEESTESSVVAFRRDPEPQDVTPDAPVEDPVPPTVPDATEMTPEATEMGEPATPVASDPQMSAPATAPDDAEKRAAPDAPSDEDPETMADEDQTVFAFDDTELSGEDDSVIDDAPDTLAEDTPVFDTAAEPATLENEEPLIAPLPDIATLPTDDGLPEPEAPSEIAPETGAPAAAADTPDTDALTFDLSDTPDGDEPGENIFADDDLAEVEVPDMATETVIPDAIEEPVPADDTAFAEDPAAEDTDAPEDMAELEETQEEPETATADVAGPAAAASGLSLPDFAQPEDAGPAVVSPGLLGLAARVSRLNADQASAIKAQMPALRQLAQAQPPQS